MPDLINDMAMIRKLTYEAFIKSGKLSAALNSEKTDPAAFAKALDDVSAQFEKAVIAVRNISETHMPQTYDARHKKCAGNIPVSIAGDVSVNEFGWLNITLNTLLPNCRFRSSLYISDTIRRLLDDYTKAGRRLPWFEKAILVIDEHCNIKNRRVYDQDNKGWKTVANALKGRVIKDDDQFSLHLCLMSQESDDLRCRIHLLDRNDIGDFLRIRYEECGGLF